MVPCWKRVRSEVGQGGRAILKALWRDDPVAARARILEVFEKTGGNVSAAWKVLRYCCRMHFFYMIRSRRMLDDLEAARIAAASKFLLRGAPRTSWRKMNFRRRKDLGLPYRPGEIGPRADR